MLLVGYGFGASFVALFMQLGGGIYTKAADVGELVILSFLFYNVGVHRPTILVNIFPKVLI